MKPVHRPRIQGRIISESLGRLVAETDMDSAEKILTFRIPSTSRRDRVYIVEVDLLSTEVSCACEAFSRGENGFREAFLMPYKFENAASQIEAVAKGRGLTMLPSITRAPRGCCPHVKRVRRWLQRHGFYHYFEMKAEQLMEKLAA